MYGRGALCWVLWVWAWLCGCGAEVVFGRYTWGDAIIDPMALGPDGQPYPSALVNKLFSEGEFGPPRNSRRGRTLHSTLDPSTTRERLLYNFHKANTPQTPEGRSMGGSAAMDNLVRSSVKASSSSTTTVSSSSSSSSSSSPTCPPGPPARLCKTRYNTTAPMYGISLTSGKPVTIVQKFPDLLQQVIFEVCESEECDVVKGKCAQTYVPYLFLVIPLGPVTLTGQDYVLVESGCACQPKYSHSSPVPSPLDAIPGLE
ncbi:hypothetical protein Pcinc_015690 [Petrolisthes cinctipes]|nr:hypothetical protein Pcinc_015690 [Petrolisthes cinctipes]